MRANSAVAFPPARRAVTSAVRSAAPSASSIAALAAAALALAACGGSTAGSSIAPDAALTGGTAPTRGFQVVSPTVELAPHSDITYCYYFHTSNRTELAIKHWTSHMTAGGQQMILFVTPSDQHEPGTLLSSACGMLASGVGPVWTYSADTPDAEIALPGDDGQGHPIGQAIRADQPAYLQIHFVNPGDQAMRAHAELTASAYDDGIEPTLAAPFIAYNTRIDLAAAADPAAPTTGTVSGSCSVAPDASFYRLSTHTFKQAVHSFVKDGDTTVFDSVHWDTASDRTWDAAPFLRFTTGKLSYQCEYQNPNSYRIQTGDSAATDEICVALGYFFPAADAAGHFCLNSTMLY
jgi:hypothetical protein